MPGAIYAEGLVKTFGDVRALDGVDLDVPEGTVLGLLGPNGAGKTTAVRCLTTLLQPDSGKAVVAGHRRPEAPQRGAPLDRPLRPVRGGRRVPDRPREPPDGRPALPDDGEGERRPARPNCWSGSTSPTPPTAPPRRTPEACAAGSTSRRPWSSRPPVMFMDEPTTGLDPRNRQQLWEVIEELVAGGTTLLLTTQYLEEADHLAHDIAVIDHGQVIARGTSDQLKARTGGERVEVVVHEREHIATAAEVLDALRQGQARSPSRSTPASSPCPVTGGAKLLAEVIRELDTRGIEIDDIGLRRPTLDDVFLSLTGHVAEAKDEAERRASAERGGEQDREADRKGGRQVSAVTDTAPRRAAPRSGRRPVRPRLAGRRQAQPDPDDPHPRDGHLRAHPADHVRGAVQLRLRRLHQRRRLHRTPPSTASS